MMYSFASYSTLPVQVVKPLQYFGYVLAKTIFQVVDLDSRHRLVRQRRARFGTRKYGAFNYSRLLTPKRWPPFQIDWFLIYFTNWVTLPQIFMSITACTSAHNLYVHTCHSYYCDLESMFSKHTYRLVAYTLCVNMVHTLYIALHTMYFALRACRTFGDKIYVNTQTYLRLQPVYAHLSYGSL